MDDPSLIRLVAYLIFVSMVVEQLLNSIKQLFPPATWKHQILWVLTLRAIGFFVACGISIVVPHTGLLFIAEMNFWYSTAVIGILCSSGSALSHDIVAIIKS